MVLLLTVGMVSVLSVSSPGCVVDILSVNVPYTHVSRAVAHHKSPNAAVNVDLRCVMKIEMSQEIVGGWSKRPQIEQFEMKGQLNLIAHRLLYY